MASKKPVVLVGGMLEQLQAADSLVGDTRSVSATIDGGGSVITVGKQVMVRIPYACIIQDVVLLADQSGSIVIDIWKAAYSAYPPTISNTITSSDLPTLSTAQQSQDATLTGWTTSVSADDCLIFHVNSVTSITQIHIALKVRTQ